VPGSSHGVAPVVLVAPDAFKGTFSAAEVAGALAEGLGEAGVAADVCPVADGGEGTLDVLLAAHGGRVEHTIAHDPLGRARSARFAILDDGRAVVETAEASGLGLVGAHERDAERASTAGTGELIVAAARSGAREILVAVGGSATTDGGHGALEAIAAAGGLGDVTVTVLCDVTTPFEQAARVFAPQKGADDAAVQRLTARLHDLASTWRRDPRGRPSTGAAGGLSGGLWAQLDAHLVPGAAAVLDAVDFDARLTRAAAVVTGEGSLDGQSLAGKVVGEIASRGRRAGVPVHAVVGRDALGREEWRALGLASVTQAPTLEALREAGRDIGERLRG
jgi:glycerate 2-kinase